MLICCHLWTICVDLMQFVSIVCWFDVFYENCSLILCILWALCDVLDSGCQRKCSIPVHISKPTHSPKCGFSEFCLDKVWIQCILPWQSVDSVHFVSTKCGFSAFCLDKVWIQCIWHRQSVDLLSLVNDLCWFGIKSFTNDNKSTQNDHYRH